MPLVSLRQGREDRVRWRQLTSFPLLPALPPALGQRDEEVCTAGQTRDEEREEGKSSRHGQEGSSASEENLGRPQGGGGTQPGLGRWSGLGVQGRREKAGKAGSDLLPARAWHVFSCLTTAFCPDAKAYLRACGQQDKEAALDLRPVSPPLPATLRLEGCRQVESHVCMQSLGLPHTSDIGSFRASLPDQGR